MIDRNFDMVVIGGGIVGLATALQATRLFPRLRLLVVEKENAVSQHQSGHNSGVIHSGIYYKPGSLKARLCVQGARAMVEFCREHQIRHEICGKVIVAHDEEELPRLRSLLERGRVNGLEGLRELNPEQIREIEPYCVGMRGVHVPQTGIADYPAVCAKYAELIAARGGEIRTSTKVLGFAQTDGQIVVETTKGAFATRHLVNCAGLHSDRMSRAAGQSPEVQIIPFRGEYYKLVPERKFLVRTLIYPVPDPRFPFLGVHFTSHVDGRVSAGPNAVLALKREGYRWKDISGRDIAEILGYGGFWRMAARNWRTGINEVYQSLNKTRFVRALQKLIPQVRAEDLVPDGSGVRAQAVQGDGSLVDDFRFTRSARMLNVCNVPSPAATASLAIAREIMGMAEAEFGLVRN